ncbi:MAG: alpha/beta hydrolase family protein [Pseudoflavonifractor sp.]|nr:alpha/beta hydrolase family protein [Alloprevotella sp.]MCM1116350.1 alpha/beta hydrolase family protein [Pseudoflavonifractor sp.]
MIRPILTLIASLLMIMPMSTMAESTRSAVDNLMRRHEPRLQYDPAIDPDSFPTWQGKMSEAMARLMKHDVFGWKEMPTPVKTASSRRDGYTIERWEAQPLEGYTVGFYVLTPDTLRYGDPAPAILCIPGFGQTKELLAGEIAGDFQLAKGGNPDAGKSAMARQYAKQGVIAVAVDNPSCGELSDDGYADYVTSSRFLLEMGWSYLGLASWQDRVILDWMKTHPNMDPERLIVSGFSLGTEPLMALGLLDSTIYAFVYNDFMCRTRERILVMNKPEANGARPFPNNIEHLIPEFLAEFDFPDIVSALAPRPVICTEGGLDRDFDIISGAYAKAGAPGAFERYHYAMYADSSKRVDVDRLPEGIDRDEFFRLCNVDPPHHYFKTEHIIPWLHRLLGGRSGE